jgi:hypothetical protein
MQYKEEAPSNRKNLEETLSIQIINQNIYV